MVVVNACQEFIDTINDGFCRVHLRYEDNFWSCKMNLKGNSKAEESQSLKDWEAFLGNEDHLKRTRALLASDNITEDQRTVLKCFERTFALYYMEDAAASTLRGTTLDMEGALLTQRKEMKLGYTDPHSKVFVECSSVQLGNLMNTSEDAELRAAVYDGLMSIGRHVADSFAALVVKRNELAKMLGFTDFYDMKVSQAEGFNKEKLFEMLDPLEAETKPIWERTLKDMPETDRQAFNIGYAMSGETTKEMSPYFPFENAIRVFGQTFGKAGISYRTSKMRLDLLDRPGKYSNGFCHWPECAYRKSDGSWKPSRANFTSVCTPNAVGSGLTSLRTLLHEGGHAAHFANIDQASPLFSQERAPTSVAYAETQSMFLDSLIGDAAWMGRYAKTLEGETIPFSIIEKSIKSKAGTSILGLRKMLVVPYFEKALYELPAGDVTGQRIQELAVEIERKIMVELSPRPVLSVPHILSDEASCYYHGYVLAQMAVYQTRSYFLKKYGQIVDNPAVGEEITKVYWAPGNSRSFLELVAELTGQELSPRAWVDHLGVPLTTKLEQEMVDYEKAVAAAAAPHDGPTAKDLNMVLELAHGDEVIASSENGGFEKACDTFAEYVRKNYK